MGQKLERLITDLGERSTYDAASQCSRCGYCEQACPTYVATGQESKSGRGRNQIVRMMLEDKFKDLGAAQEALSTCLLCGACSTACYAHVPTADIVLEGRRMLRGKPHWLVSIVTSLLVFDAQRLAAILKIAYSFKKMGLLRLGRPFLRLLGLPGLAEADAHVDEAPEEFLFEKLKSEGLSSGEAPGWLYFAPCGPNYLYPRVGLSTVKALKSLSGPGCFMGNNCCGLLCYNYGSVEDARALAKANIEKAEQSETGLAPIVGDCSSCVSFLKSYPQLFLEDLEWKPRAERFASRLRDAVEVFDDHTLSTDALPGPIVYHESCRACHGQGLKAPKDFLRRMLGVAYRDLPESDVCCGGAGAFSFVYQELSDEVLRRKIGHIASVQARVVVTSSTSCLIQLAHGLKKYYPEGSVIHISELVSQAAQEKD